MEERDVFVLESGEVAAAAECVRLSRTGAHLPVLDLARG